MTIPLNLHVSLPDDYTTLDSFQTRRDEVDQRLADLEAQAAAVTDQRVADLEAQIATLTTELDAVKQGKASAADLDTVRTDLSAVETTVTDLGTRLGDFSFAVGDVAAYAAAGDLPPQQLFLVVDTPDNLTALTEQQLAEGTPAQAYSIYVGV